MTDDKIHSLNVTQLFYKKEPDFRPLQTVNTFLKIQKEKYFYKLFGMHLKWRVK